jgi:Ni/Co efflux regulator RcnB
MTRLLATLMLALPLAATPALAQEKKEEKKEMSTQQSKMGSCNKDAGDKKGDERKAFMKDCLSKEKDAKAANQKKFGDCSSSLKGQKLSKDERSTKMKECMAK